MKNKKDLNYLLILPETSPLATAWISSIVARLKSPWKVCAKADAAIAKSSLQKKHLLRLLDQLFVFHIFLT